MQRDSVCTTALFKVVLKANGKGKSQMMSLTGSSKWFYQIVRGLEGAGGGGIGRWATRSSGVEICMDRREGTKVFIHMLAPARERH